MHRDQLWLWAPPYPLRDVLNRARLREVPSQPGVYLMTGRERPTAEPRVLYVGKSLNLRRRLASYRGIASDRATRRLVRLAFSVDSVTWETCADDHAARLRENILLRLHRPRFNTANTHPEGHWYAVVRAGHAGFELARTREPEPRSACFGAFKQAAAFGAVVRALWVALNPHRDVSAMPVNLFAAKPRGALGFDWAAAHGDTTGLSVLLRHLTEYFGGTSPGLVSWMRERLSPAMARSAFARTWLTTDLETADRFFAQVTLRHAALRRRFGIPGTLVSPARLDDLIALAQATQAAREHASRTQPRTTAEPETAWSKPL
jgi:hypothetical protein